MATVSEKREVSGFNAIAVSGYGDLLIQQVSDDQPESLVIEADESILPNLKSEVIDGVLELGYKVPWWDLGYWIEWAFQPNKTILFHINTHRLNSVSISGSGSLVTERMTSDQLRLRVSGSGKIRIGTIEAESLSTTLSGSGDVEMAGKVQRHEINISGSGSLRILDLETQVTSVTISGSGNVRTHAQEELSVRISGSGEVRYRGQPRISQHISGAGRVAEV